MSSWLAPFLLALFAWLAAPSEGKAGCDEYLRPHGGGIYYRCDNDSGTGGGGGGGGIDYGAAAGALGALGDMLERHSRPPSSGSGCAPGYGLCPGGGCAPLGSVCCGGKYCSQGDVCVSDGTCLSRNSRRICPGGNNICKPGYICDEGGSCIAAASKRICASGYICPSGEICTGNGSCLWASSQRICASGYICSSGEICTRDGNCLSASSPRICANGNGVCKEGYLCTRDGQCLSRQSRQVCANGSYCAAGQACIDGNKCLSAASERFCADGRYCQEGYLCTKDGSCLSLQSNRVCSNGSYCPAGQACIEGNTCLFAKSERFCSDRSYCDEGYVCRSDRQCYSKKEIERQEAERKEEKGRRAALEEDLHLPAENPFSAKLDEDLRLPDENPFSSEKTADASCEPPDDSRVTGLPGGDSAPRRSIGATPCARMPGWSKPEPYNHSSKPVTVYRGNGPSIEIPPGFGLWMETGGALLAKAWDGKGLDSNASGPADEEECAVIALQGWVSPHCQEKRWRDDLEALARKARAESRTREQCLAMNGAIIDPNRGARDEEACTRGGDKILLVDDSDSLRKSGWFAKYNPKACSSSGASQQKIRNSSAPAAVCYVLQNGGPHYDLYSIRDDENQKEVLTSPTGRNPFSSSLDLDRAASGPH